MAIGIKQRIKEGEKEVKPTRYYSSKQEKAVAKVIGGRTTANSGATDFSGKGDILTSGNYEESFLIECKTKTANSESISIKREWFEKNRAEATFEGKAHQAIVFNFGPDAPYNENHYIIDEYLFLALQEYLKERNS